MICSHLVNLSLLFGAILSWGIMWPLISHQKGHWFPATLSQSSMKSLTGYKVCFIKTKTKNKNKNKNHSLLNCFQKHM